MIYLFSLIKEEIKYKQLHRLRGLQNNMIYLWMLNVKYFNQELLCVWLSKCIGKYVTGFAFFRVLRTFIKCWKS